MPRATPAQVERLIADDELSERLARL
jgi:hypothetical protein